MSRNSKKLEERDTKTDKGSEFSKKIFICKDDLIDNGSKILTLRHPGSGEGATFLIQDNIKVILEVLQFDQPHRSWFFKKSVSSDGKCYICTPTDIMFFMIYYLRKQCMTQAIPPEQWKDDEYPNMTEILRTFTYTSMIKLTDVKRSGDIIAYKFNVKKCLAWLALKTKKLAKVLKDERIYSGSNAVSANYTRSDVFDSMEEDEYLKYACGIIGNYIDEDLHKQLLTYFSIEVEDTGKKKRKSTKMHEIELNSKKIKLEEITSPDTVKEKPKKISTKAKVLAKAAVGTKSIASFFKK